MVDLLEIDIGLGYQGVICTLVYSSRCLDTMLLGNSLPELVANLVPTLADLQSYDFSHVL